MTDIDPSSIPHFPSHATLVPQRGRESSPDEFIDPETGVSCPPGIQGPTMVPLWWLDNDLRSVDVVDVDPEEDFEEDYEEENAWMDPAHFGVPGNMYNPGEHFKWIVEGEDLLESVVEILRGHAEYLENLHKKGWVITNPIDNGHMDLHWKGDGSPPAEDSGYIDGTRADGKKWEGREPA